MSMIDDLLDMFSDTVVVHPGYLDEYGNWVASGATATYPCRIEGSTRLVRDMTGREVVSSVQLIVAGAYDLTTHSHRYTLPSRFIPSGQLMAISVTRVTDEDGPLYEAVNLP